MGLEDEGGNLKSTTASGRALSPCAIRPSPGAFSLRRTAQPSQSSTDAASRQIIYPPSPLSPDSFHAKTFLLREPKQPSDKTNPLLRGPSKGLWKPQSRLGLPAEGSWERSHSQRWRMHVARRAPSEVSALHRYLISEVQHIPEKRDAAQLPNLEIEE